MLSQSQLATIHLAIGNPEKLVFLPLRIKLIMVSSKVFFSYIGCVLSKQHFSISSVIDSYIVGM